MSGQDALHERTGLAVFAALHAKTTVNAALAAHGLPSRELEQLLALPPVVETAVAEYQLALVRVAVLLAFAQGDQWPGLPVARKQAYLTEAFDVVNQLSPNDT